MIGTHDGTTGKSYEDHFDYLIDNPAYVTPNTKVAANVIQGNLRDMDMQIGADYIPREAPITSSGSPPQAPTEPTGAISGSYRTLPSGSFQPARLGTVEEDSVVAGNIPLLPIVPSGSIQGPGEPNANHWIKDNTGKPIDRMPPIKTYPGDYGKRLGFLPDISKKQGNWPKVVDYAMKVLDPDKMAKSTPETPIQDLLKTEYHSTSLGKAMTKASEEYEQEHGLDHIDALKKMKVNPKSWDDWLESRPESKNIQDRREGMTNGQYLIQRLQDLHRLGSWETEDIEGYVPK